jgi:hypothetical protein
VGTLLLSPPPLALSFAYNFRLAAAKRNRRRAPHHNRPTATTAQAITLLVYTAATTKPADIACLSCSMVSLPCPSIGKDTKTNTGPDQNDKLGA